MSPFKKEGQTSDVWCVCAKSLCMQFCFRARISFCIFQPTQAIKIHCTLFAGALFNDAINASHENVRLRERERERGFGVDCLHFSLMTPQKWEESTLKVHLLNFFPFPLSQDRFFELQLNVLFCSVLIYALDWVLGAKSDMRQNSKVYLFSLQMLLLLSSLSFTPVLVLLTFFGTKWFHLPFCDAADANVVLLVKFHSNKFIPQTGWATG